MKTTRVGVVDRAPATRKILLRLGPGLEPVEVDYPTVESRFAGSYREPATDQPGLVMDDQGRVYLVNPDGTRTLLPGSGGGLPTGWTQSGDPAVVNMNGGGLVSGDTSLEDGFLNMIQGGGQVNVTAAFGITSQPTAGSPAFTAGTFGGATVALDAGGLDVENVGIITVNDGVAQSQYYAEGLSTAKLVGAEAYTLGIGVGVTSAPPAGVPAFLASGAAGGTVALDAGDLAIHGGGGYADWVDGSNATQINAEGINATDGAGAGSTLLNDGRLGLRPGNNQTAISIDPSNGPLGALDAGGLDVTNVGLLSGQRASLSPTADVTVLQVVAAAQGSDLLQVLDSGTFYGLRVTGAAAILATGASGVFVNLDTTTGSIGFFGASPVGQAATPVTLGDVIAVLQAFGLVS